METVKTHEASTTLREAAESGELKHWTEALTGIVVGTFPKMGWRGAARGHRSDLLPVPRSEYLALDVVAFETAGDRRWRFPVGVFELENSPVDDLVAYSLWKVLCVRASLRVVFCYRRTQARGRSWCATSPTRSSRRWRSRRVPASAAKRSSSSARAAKPPPSLTASSRTGRSTPTRRASVATDRRPSMALKPWYKVITPREDLRDGRPLDASEFAVHLDHVRDGRAPTTTRSRSGSSTGRT